MINTKTNENKAYRTEDVGATFKEAVEFDDRVVIISYDKIRIYDNETFYLIDEFDFGSTMASNYIDDKDFLMVLLGLDVEIYKMEMRKK